MIKKISLYVNFQFWKEDFCFYSPNGKFICFHGSICKNFSEQSLNPIKFKFFISKSKAYLNNPNINIYDEDYLIYKEPTPLTRYQLLDFS